MDMFISFFKPLSLVMNKINLYNVWEVYTYRLIIHIAYFTQYQAVSCLE